MATSFDKVRRVRTFDDVLDQLREAILSGRIRPGERLPGERQLCEEFGVGRPTLREALRSLEAVGMIEVRPGKGGGSYAVTPSESTLGDALASLVEPARRVPRGPGRVPRRLRGRERRLGRPARGRGRHRDAVQALVVEGREAGDVEALAEVDVRWHEALARATKNRLRIGIALGIHGAVTRRHNQLVRPAAYEHALTIPDDLDAITAAVGDGDAELARALMREHIDAWNRRTI